MTNFLHDFTIQNQYVLCFIRVAKVLCRPRCIAVLGLVFLCIQFLLLILYGHNACKGDACQNGNTNGSNFFRIFLLNIFSKRVEEPKLPYCLLVPPDLVGEVKPKTEVLTWSELESKFPDIKHGGHFKPRNCTSRHRVALVVPFRDRDVYLKILLNNLHALLPRQQLDYTIYVIDLDPSVRFNRALLLNVGVLESLKLYDYQCFIFHDVDLLPENDNNIYSCPEHPRHMSVAVDRLRYKLLYKTAFGGVAAMTKEQFYKVNGYSNRYFGWGGEDDDMFNRINATNQTIERYPEDIARYTMLPHVKQEENLARFDILKSGRETFRKDGINTLQYKRLAFDVRKLYTYIQVTVNQSAITSGRGIRYN